MYIPLEEGETVVLKVHKHWWFIVVRIIALSIMLLLPLIVWAVLRAYDLVVLTQAGAASFVALSALWILVGWVLFWQFWTLYYMDMWIITDRRLIDIDYKGFFDRNIAMLRLNKVQDMTVEVKGVIGSLLGFGHVLVQTAGTSEEFIIDQVSDPEGLRSKISELIGSKESAPQKVQIIA